MDISTYNFEEREPLYIDLDTLNIKVAKGKYSKMSHAEWFNECNIPFVHTVRGYYLKNDQDEFIMLYWNDFEVPNMNASVYSQIFSYFPNIKWLGLGCHIGKVGTCWNPKYIIIRNINDLSSK